jgi:hypothetical protein
LIVIKKKGYKIKKDIINTVKNHVFQMGANMRLIVFKGVKIQILEISYEV